MECTRKTVAGDKVDVHYRGTLTDGTEFDASYNRGQPLSFTVGQGQVIKGWDQGLLDMCPGEKRKLTIQPEWAYGSRGVGPIPANSVLSKSGCNSTGGHENSGLTSHSIRVGVGVYRWSLQRRTIDVARGGVTTRWR